MKNNRKHLPAFLSGMLLMALLTALAGTALAASGAVSFNTANVSINGKRILTKGQDLTTASGAAIPSTILYTDAQGGTTNYIPIRPFTEALHIPIRWDGNSDTVSVQVTGEQALHMLSLFSEYTVYDGIFEEIVPIPSTTGKALLKEMKHESTDAFDAELSPNSKDGNFVSITITNHGRAPLQFSLGRKYGSTTVATPTQVPADATVTRTIKILSAEKMANASVFMELSNAEYSARPISATISAVQFAATGENLERVITAVSNGDAETAARLRKASAIMVNGDYPKNAKGETYGPNALSKLTGHAPVLLQAVGTKGESGYIRETDDPSYQYQNKTPAEIAALQASLPDTFTIPLYDSEGVVIGEFPMGGSTPTVQGKDIAAVKAEIAAAS